MHCGTNHRLTWTLPRLVALPSTTVFMLIAGFSSPASENMELNASTMTGEIDSTFLEIQSVMAKEVQLRLRLDELLAERRRKAEETLEEAKRHLKEVEEDEKERRIKLARKVCSGFIITAYGM
jgi:hypothetical protein